jgi:hypothetical protein
MDTATDGPALCRIPAFADPVELKLAEGEHDPGDELHVRAP